MIHVPPCIDRQRRALRLDSERRGGAAPRVLLCGGLCESVGLFARSEEVMIVEARQQVLSRLAVVLEQLKAGRVSRSFDWRH